MRKHTVLGILICTLFFFALLNRKSAPPVVHAIGTKKLTSCLSEKKFIMYGEKDCSACAIQKSYFGEDFSLVPYVECDTNRKLCDEKGIHAYPTWEDAAGKQYKGAIPLDTLASLAQCSLRSPTPTRSRIYPSLLPTALPSSLQQSGIITPTVSPPHPPPLVKREELLAAFVAGLLSFLAPCLLPLFPTYFSVITGFTFADLYGLNFEKIRGRIFLSSVFFVLGFSLVFTLLGLTGSYIGQRINSNLLPLLRLNGAFLITLGLIQTGIIQFHSLTFDYAWTIQRKLQRLGYLTATVTGVTSALSWIPCVGPLLSSVLLLAANEASTGRGMLLLFTYSTGITLPFLSAGLLFPTFVKKIHEHRTMLHRISLLAGCFMIAFGLILLFGQYRYYIDAVQSIAGKIPKW